MRATILIICTLLTIVGASAEGLVFESQLWDIGSIEEEGGVVKHKFHFSNQGSKPIVIHNVRSSCGCTTSEYSRSPLAGGDSSSLEVTFDPRYQSGAINKRVYIYSTASAEPLELLLTGRVNPRKRSIEERYPYVLSSGVRIGATYISVSGVESGVVSQSMVGYTNRSGRGVEIEFRPLTQRDRLQLFYDSGVGSGEELQLNLGYSIDHPLDKDERLYDTLAIYINGVLSNHRLYIQGVSNISQP